MAGRWGPSGPPPSPYGAPGVPPGPPFPPAPRTGPYGPAPRTGPYAPAPPTGPYGPGRPPVYPGGPGGPGGPPRPYGPSLGPPPAGPYSYTPPPRRRGGGGAIWFVGLLGVLAIAGVAYFVIAQAMASTKEKHMAEASPSPSVAPTQSKTGKVPHGRAAAVANPLYRLPKKPGLPCRAPVLDTHDPQSVNRFLTKISDCLDQSWAREFKSANIPFNPPTRVYWTQPGTSPCGSYPAPGAAAFYCPTNHAMYIGLTDVVKNSADAPGKYYGIYVSVLAHEYGHHVQSAAGILQYGDNLEETSGSGKNAVSRRIELQAQCFDGVYLHSIGQTLPLTPIQRKIILYDAYYRGDRAGLPPDHGSRKHFRGWTKRGLSSGLPGRCNTWTASAGNTG